jgi:hypothetical protein
MSGAKIGLGLLVTLIAGSFTATPVLAMEGVDNLTVDNSCSAEQKAVVEDAFRAANLLIHFSWMAVSAIDELRKNQYQSEEEWERNLPENFKVHKYTGLKFDLWRVREWYSKVFRVGKNERWDANDKKVLDVVDQKYATVTPLTFPVLAVCELEDNRGCSSGDGDFANVELLKGLGRPRREDSMPFDAKIRICPKFFKYSLEEANKLALYKSNEDIELFRAGIIVHELMHLNFMNTRSGVDMDYGLEHVLTTSPDEAKDNPDSYHVFTLLIYGHGRAPKCVRPPDRWKNC